MVDWQIYRIKEWNKDLGENEDYARKAILTILKDQKVSLSKTRALFNHILEDIEDNNPITMGNDEYYTDSLKSIAESLNKISNKGVDTFSRCITTNAN